MLWITRSSFAAARLLQQFRTFARAAKAIAPQKQQATQRILTAEQLHSKYAEGLQRDEINNIFDMVARIELCGNQVSGRIWDQTDYLLQNSNNSEISSLSDRQLSQLLSVYGKKCSSVARHRKKHRLDTVLIYLAGKGVKCGALSRTAVFAAKLDNGEIPNVVEEVTEWEANGLGSTKEIFQEFARAYALNGNVQGVVKIINHLKSSPIPMPVDENIIGSLIYAYAVNGQSEHAEAIVTKFSQMLSEIVLRSAFAEGLIKAGKTEEAIEVISKCDSLETLRRENIHILRVMCDLIENNVHDAFARLSDLIVKSEDGTTLAEKNNNIYVLNRAVAARNNGNPRASKAMYTILHPKYKKQQLKNNLDRDFIIEGIVYEQAKKLEAKGE